MARLILFCTVIAVLSPSTGRAASGEAPAERISLTPAERDWIAAHPVAVVGIGGSFAPFSFTGPDGRLVGIDEDYLALIARSTGLKFENRTFPTWPEAVEEFKAGRVDVLTSLGRTAERESYILFAGPYTSAPNVIVTRTDTPYLLDLRELKGQRVGVARGYAGLINVLKRSSPDCIIVEYDTMDDALEAVAHGGIDAIIADVVNASYAIKSLHLANLRLGSIIPGSPSDTSNFIGVRRTLPLLAQIIDKAIAGVTPLQRKEIDDRWIGLDYSPSKWVRAFKVAAAIAALAVLVFLLAFFNSRRLARELAERRRIQAALEEAHAQLARVSEEKSALLHMVAHDLRSPLTGFQLGAELLQSEAPRLSEAGKDTLASMSDAVELMRRMVDDLVDVHALEEGRHDYQSLEVDLRGLVREAAAAFAETAARKEIHLALETGQTALPLWTDAKALRQVIDNLISNAIKYSPARTEVRIDLHQNGNGCRLQVGDRGPGVKPDERERIFEKYAVGSALPTGGEKSTGLGLWIVRRIVTGLHGKVWCEGGPGSTGALFIVEMPVTPR